MFDTSAVNATYADVARLKRDLACLDDSNTRHRQHLLNVRIQQVERIIEQSNAIYRKLQSGELQP